MRDQEFTQAWLCSAGEVLQYLPCVYAARLIANADGSQLESIHLLTGTDRNPKQIARDVQSALSAAYGLDIDHRIISIAQMPVNPLHSDSESPAEAPPLDPFPPDTARPLYRGISMEEFSRRINVRVSLEYKGSIYEGAAAGQAGELWRDQLAAQATLDAIRKLPGGKNEYALLSVHPFQTALLRLSIVLVQYQEDGQILTGAAPVEEGTLHGVIKATLDAVNRHLSGRLSSFS